MTEASIFAFLERKSPNAVHFVLSGVAKLLAKLVKLFWLTENEPENILGKISALMQISASHLTVGLLISGVIVDEMNNISTDSHMVYSEHRKIAISFRGSFLFGMQNFECLANLHFFIFRSDFVGHFQI